MQSRRNCRAAAFAAAVWMVAAEIPCISVVGNGEMTAYELSTFSNCGLIVRFNTMRTLDPQCTRTDICAFRQVAETNRFYGYDYDQTFHGRTTCPMMLFVGTNSTANFHSPLPRNSSVLSRYIECGKNKLTYGDKVFQAREQSPFSSGFCTILWLLRNFPYYSIRVFGFNFHGWNGHDFKYEHKLLQDPVFSERVIFSMSPVYSQQEEKLDGLSYFKARKWRK